MERLIIISTMPSAKIVAHSSFQTYFETDHKYLSYSYSLCYSMEKIC